MVPMIGSFMVSQIPIKKIISDTAWPGMPNTVTRKKVSCIRTKL